MKPLGAASLPQERENACWITQSCQQGAAVGTSRWCHLYSWLMAGLWPGEGWGCWRIKMIKSATRMCTEYFLLQKSDFQGYLFRVHNALTLLERRMLKNRTVKWAWQLQVSAWGELLDGFISLNYTTGGKAAFILSSSQVVPFLEEQDKLPTVDWTIPVN